MTLKSRVLLVDDDERLLKGAKRILHKTVNLHTAVGGAKALEMLEAGGPYAVIISDQNMPDMKGTVLLEQVSKRWPTTVRIMLTGNNDLQTATSAVNSGQIFRFLNKPCDTKDLVKAIQDGQQQYNLLTAEKELLEQTLSGSVKVLVDVLALTNPKAFEIASEVNTLAKVFTRIETIERPWEFEIASMLWPLGDIALPIELLAKITNGIQLEASEKDLVNESPKFARDLICNIPRMENIAQTIYYAGKNFDGTGYPNDKVKGQDICQQARLLHILIDFVKTRSNLGCSNLETFKRLKEKSHLYDPQLLSEVAKMLKDQPELKTDIQAEVVTLNLMSLEEGDIIVDDIIDNQNRKLLSANNKLTKLMIQRLRNMYKLGLIPKSLVVKRKEKNQKIAS